MRLKDRKSCDEWPAKNETFAEFFVRKDREDNEQSKIGMILLGLIVAASAISLAVQALDEYFL